MKTRHGVIEDARVVTDCGRHPGVRELEQRRSTRSEKEGRFAMNFPTERGRPEDAGSGVRGSGSDDLKVSFQPIERNRSHSRTRDYCVVWGWRRGLADHNLTLTAAYVEE